MGMTNQETDTALILEAELKRRVTEVLSGVVHKVVREQIEKTFAEHKSHMLMEISIAVGKMLRVIEEEGRNPLWEASPSDFGFGKKELETFKTVEFEPEKDITNAIHEVTTSVQARVPNATKARGGRRAARAPTSP